MNNNKYNIEFSHIYSNEKASREHFNSAWIMNREKEKLLNQGAKVVTSLLIDEYNPTEEILNVDEFLEQLKEYDALPDFIVNESSLVSYKNEALEVINKKRLLKSYKRYIKKNGIVPCSFLIVIWNLLRLGVLGTEKLDIRVLNSDLEVEDFVVDSTLSILPERYQAVEEVAMDVIRNSDFADLENSIKQLYY